MAVHEFLVLQTAATKAQERIDRIVCLYIQQVLNSTPLRGLVALRDIIALEPVATPLLREE